MIDAGAARTAADNGPFVDDHNLRSPFRRMYGSMASRDASAQDEDIGGDNVLLSIIHGIRPFCHAGIDEIRHVPFPPGMNAAMGAHAPAATIAHSPIQENT
jgi:hypothetical protein